MNKLGIHIENCEGDSIPNLSRFAHYIGVVSQINGSLIEDVTITGQRNHGPETTSPDGTHLRLGAEALPPMFSAKPSAVAAWCGAALHGFAHSRYSPRTDEPLRGTLMKRRLHRTWNMIEDARIERLLLRDFPGWQPYLLGAVNHILLGPGASMSSVFPLVVGRTYLPAALRQECYEAFAEENSEYIADAVRDLVLQYLTVVDPGSEDHDLTVDIVTRLHALLGDYGSDCGSHEVEDGERSWTDPGDPSEDDEQDGNHTVTDGDESDGDESESESDESDESDEDGDESESDDGDGESGDEDGDSEDGDEDGDDGESDGDSGDDGDGDDGESDDNDADGDMSDDGDDDDDGEFEDVGGEGVGGGGESTSRLAEWASAIDAALAQDERLADVAEAVTSGPMPLIQLEQRNVVKWPVPADVRDAEYDIARELRVLMDGARPGVRRRVDRGRFNVARVVREGGTTRPEEMFDRHDPGALRSTGCAVAVLADVSGSMSRDQIAGAMSSVWSIDRAVQSVRGSFKGYTFGLDSQELPSSVADGMWVPACQDGETNPVAGLASAQAWLSQQREPNKLCIVATDGAWSSHDTCVETMSSMVHAGVQVAVFGIECDVTRRFRTEAGITTFNVRSAAQIGPVIGEMLVGRVRKSLHR